MKIKGFHRGLMNWICEFELDGRAQVAYFDRAIGKWMFAHMERIDVATKGEMDLEMTEKLREHLKNIGLITEKNTTANNGHNQGEEE